MVPTFDQIQSAAYHRWLHRGGKHGLDRDDWLAAEQQLWFAVNYRVIVRHVLGGPVRRVLGNTARPRCRFCEGGAPVATFGPPFPIVPEALENTALLSAEVCDDCRDLLEGGLFREFQRVAHPWIAGSTLPAAVERMPIAAFKALVAMALLVLPEAELGLVEDAVEWVANPDHALDSPTLSTLEGRLLIVPEPPPPACVVVARRRNDDDALPYLVFALATGRALFQIPLPMCTRDDDLDGTALVAPEASRAGVIGSDTEPSVTARIRLAPARTAREPASTYVKTA
jgi:hypothetical protein